MAADNEIRISVKGTGLALSKKLAELHRGCIWAESNGEGTGSCYYFSIPLEGRTLIT